MTARLAAAVLALLPRGVQADVMILNELTYPIYVYNVLGGQYECGDNRAQVIQEFTLFPLHAANIPWSRTGCGTSVKVSKQKTLAAGIFALEYTINSQPEYPDLFINLSDVDGGGPGITATTFKDANVVTVPIGGVCNVRQISCPAGQVCTMAYQFPHDDVKVATCWVRPTHWKVMFKQR